MSNESPYPAPPASGQPSKKKGSGCLIAIIVTLVLALIAAAVVVGLSFWGWNKFKDRFATEPAKVAEMANGIAMLDPGEQWTPQFAMDIFFMRMAVFKGGAGVNGGILVITDGDPATMGTGEKFEAQMRAQISEQSSKQGGNQLEPTSQLSSTRQDIVIRGVPASFLVIESQGVNSGTRFLEVSGSFDSKQAGRTAFIYLRVPADTMTLDDVKQLLESIE